MLEHPIGKKMYEFQSTLPLRGATSAACSSSAWIEFQSTLPLRGATNEACEAIVGDTFQSTLPLRGATGPSARSGPETRYFNPRSPCGERLDYDRGTRECEISIHAPLAGSDPGLPTPKLRRRYFNPRSPCGERPRASPTRSSSTKDFNPRSPCGERQVLITALLAV